MTDKKEIINNFLDKLNAENCNQVKGDSDMDEMFGKGKLFSVVCNKCGSLDIEIIGERGINYGGQTGYQEGSTAIKCNKCGSALTVWG
jgi:ribosomal protein S27E